MNFKTCVRRKEVKKLSISLSLLLGLSLLFATSGCQPDKSSPEAILKNLDAVQAVAIANEWKWSDKSIKSYVTGREVVFEWSKSKVKKIPLPEEKMLVAVAPYVDRTHK